MRAPALKNNGKPFAACGYFIFSVEDIRRNAHPRDCETSWIALPSEALGMHKAPYVKKLEVLDTFKDCEMRYD